MRKFSVKLEAVTPVVLGGVYERDAGENYE